MVTSNTQSRKPLAVTIGDPAGIGADVILKAWVDHLSGAIPPLPRFVLLCDPEHLEERAKQLELCINISDGWSGKENTASSETILVRKLNSRFASMPGIPAKQDAKGVVEAISTAVNLTRTGETRGIVTLPINKKSLYDAGFEYPGHTEFLGALASEFEGTEAQFKPVMMLAGPDLRAVPVTIHIPLSEVPSALTTDEIIKVISITARDLERRFHIKAPRIAVSGLNPHAGEEGAMGREDIEVIAPAIATLQKLGIDCFGPLPADTMFHKAARSRYDAAVCMYHDQALIPAKALAFDDTVNVTLGLPFVRTSPDHGTAYDIAGTGKANPASTIAALRMADSMALDSFR